MITIVGISSVLVILAPMVLILGFLIFLFAETLHSAWIHFTWTPPKIQPSATFNGVFIRHMGDEEFKQLLNIRSYVFKFPKAITNIGITTLSKRENRAETCFNIYKTCSFLKLHLEQSGKSIPKNLLEQYRRHIPQDLWEMTETEYQSILLKINSAEDFKRFLLLKETPSELRKVA